MDESRDAVKYFAVLIGIDFYKDAPLKGCVRDAKDMADYLKYAQPAAQLCTFTASPPDDAESSLPAEHPRAWPTIDNVVAKIREIASVARSGDYVHIHYSGHGTRMEPTGELALDLLGDMNDTGVRYLRGNEFALLLRDLVFKHLEVSVVLDCCFSGGVSRDDSSVRYLDYNPKADAEYPMAVHGLIPEDENASESHRNASMKPNWLMDPDGYTIITACGPLEKAREIRLPDGKRHGALSYFLLRTLIGFGGFAKKQNHIYHQLCARFKEYWPQQNPMFYGNRDKCFFSRSISEAGTIIVQAVRKKNGTFQLQAGQAQGICNGDQVAIYPNDSMERRSAAYQSRIVAFVTHTAAFQSTLVVSELGYMGTQTWWTAVVLTENYLNKYPICIPRDMPFREEWVTALGERSLRSVAKGEDPFAFSIAFKDKNYEIFDKSANEMIHISAMAKVRETPDQVCDIVHHLTKFEMVKDLAHNFSKSSFKKLCKVELATSSGATFSSGHSVRVNHRAMVTLIAENMGHDDLYLYIYDMGPEKQVENILQGNHHVLPSRYNDQAPNGTARKTWKLRMEVPKGLREKGQALCKDRIIVFVTSQLTSFDLLELPKLSQLAKKRRPGKACRGGEALSGGDWACFTFSVATHIHD
ncbi:caspase domain-containing protein [Colletotrichum truncatum]|uniref:Caspase domain-containing protein n=1 Tax=Colletotrichum truncatum TaxID=5467 RepID=A0ACC3YL32_COLTU|nr:caspase domain-containing protein [Colletotrichum truncatum]KAF6782599.1 caspase domain-containing protein [Colletotrichum truncatum]